MKNVIKSIVAFALIAHLSCAQKKPDQQQSIRLNQIGFFPQASKQAIIINSDQSDFYIITLNSTDKLFTGKLTASRQSQFNKKTSIADFTAFTSTGTFVLVVPALGQSYPFEIKPNIYHNVADATLKAFYYQRASTPILKTYAGNWARAAGHADDKVIVHPSAVSTGRAAGNTITSSRGWYDAGDYNKYIVNSGITMGTLFSAYEDYPEYFKTQNLNIPESSNVIPDLLDESLWNLRWMLTMQDPYDGGVYHKLTNAAFDGMIMPDKATAPRYVVQKGTAATLDFAAVTAQASRIFSAYKDELPGLADSCLIASQKAWAWAIKNPAVVYDQNAINKAFDPDITTGAYGDNNFKDEWTWAACELFVTTHDQQYLKTIQAPSTKTFTIPAWNQVAMLGYYTIIREQENLKVDNKAATLIDTLKSNMIRFADQLMNGAEQSTYGTVMGKSAHDFIWGSNAVAANQGIALLQAYNISKDKKYLIAAIHNADYLLGRNGTGYSFITGFGYKPSLNPHHRPSIADGITAPVPGWLVGGANPGKQDHCSYTSSVPDEAYSDTSCSYASNEVAINWNAPAVYLLNALEALYSNP